MMRTQQFGIPLQLSFTDMWSSSVLAPGREALRPDTLALGATPLLATRYFERSLQPSAELVRLGDIIPLPKLSDLQSFDLKTLPPHLLAGQIKAFSNLFIQHRVGERTSSEVRLLAKSEDLFFHVAIRSVTDLHFDKDDEGMIVPVSVTKESSVEIHFYEEEYPGSKTSPFSFRALEPVASLYPFAPHKQVLPALAYAFFHSIDVFNSAVPQQGKDWKAIERTFREY
jgi:hypothetical protein